MTNQVEFTSRAFKQLEKFSKDLQQRIKNKIYELAENPRPTGIVKLENSDRYRIRVGGDRVLYEIEDSL